MHTFSEVYMVSPKCYSSMVAIYRIETFYPRFNYMHEMKMGSVTNQRLMP
jgi:hypothetical protein